MSYVDGFLIVVPKKKLPAYKKMAKLGGKMWMKHGALQYFECVGDDMKPEWCELPFPKLMKAKPSEVVLYSFIIYKNKAHRNAVNKKVMKDPAMGEPPADMPFDMKKMAFGGFSAIVEH